MRFMLMVKADQDYEAGRPPKPELIDAIGQLSEQMIQAGVLIETGGLLPSTCGARVRVSGGKLSVTDGPFAETKELVGGYAVVEAASCDEAIALGRQFMDLHARILGPSYEGECEIRQMFDGPDCGSAARCMENELASVRLCARDNRPRSACRLVSAGRRGASRYAHPRPCRVISQHLPPRGGQNIRREPFERGAGV
jgi:hypothetical protein